MTARSTRCGWNGSSPSADRVVGAVFPERIEAGLRGHGTLSVADHAVGEVQDEADIGRSYGEVTESGFAGTRPVGLFTTPCTGTLGALLMLMSTLTQ